MHGVGCACPRCESLGCEQLLCWEHVSWHDRGSGWLPKTWQAMTAALRVEHRQALPQLAYLLVYACVSFLASAALS